MWFLALLTPLLLLAAFVLLLLTTLSTPIIKSIYLIKIVADADGALGSSVDGQARFGVWGYCTSGVRAAALGISKTAQNYCSSKRLGYTIDNRLATTLHLNNWQNLITRSLSAVLVLHPIACGLTFLALLSALLMVRPSRGTTRFSALLTTLLSLVAALLATVIFIVDCVVVGIVRSRVSKESDALSVGWGNGVWMTLGAAVALWIAIITAACGLFQIRRQRRADAAAVRY